MKKFLLIVLGLVVLLIGVALALPFIIPTETYKQQLTAQVERATGRQLSIQGPLHLSLLPSVGLKAENVRFANAPGAADPDMARLKALEVELKVWPLLHGAVEVARFVLVEPEIHLEVAKDGRPNWQFGPKAGQGDQPGPGRRRRSGRHLEPAGLRDQARRHPDRERHAHLCRCDQRRPRAGRGDQPHPPAAGSGKPAACGRRARLQRPDDQAEPEARPAARGDPGRHLGPPARGRFDARQIRLHRPGQQWRPARGRGRPRSLRALDPQARGLARQAARLPGPGPADAHDQGQARRLAQARGADRRRDRPRPDRGQGRAGRRPRRRAAQGRRPARSRRGRPQPLSAAAGSPRPASRPRPASSRVASSRAAGRRRPPDARRASNLRPRPPPPAGPTSRSRCRPWAAPRSRSS